MTRSWRNTIWPVWMLVAVLSGCAAPYTYYGDDCPDGGCGSVPMHGYAELSGRYADANPLACDEPACDDPGCEQCADCGQAPRVCRHTLTDLLIRSRTCNAGCSRVYWGEWSFDPPDDCDPCDNYGQWVGPQCCPPRGWQRALSGLVGHRAGGCDQAAPCAGCLDGTGVPAGDMIWSDPLPAVDGSEIGGPAIAPDNRPDDAPVAQPYYSRDPQSRLVPRGNN